MFSMTDTLLGFTVYNMVGNISLWGGYYNTALSANVR